MEQWKTREVKTRNDVAEVLLDMIRPLKSRYSQGFAWLHVGDSGAHYGDKTARMEGFARVMWGLGPLWAGDNKNLPQELQEEADWWLEHYRMGIIHGTDPDHEEYWGDVPDYDQKMVEMAALVTGISLCPEKLWYALAQKEQDNLYAWLNQINDHKVHPNNWRFFRILVNMTFDLLGLPWSRECMEDDLGIIEGCYTGDGWYYDGNPGQLDYYIPFAMHYYGLIYGKMMETKDNAYSATLKDRADTFAKDFIYWFGGDGNEVPFGRSLTYRFAHGAFFSAMGFAQVEGPGYGVMKHLALKNLQTWIRRPILDGSGALSIGYGYPNLFMCERYNAPGSPYWAFKIFLMLAMGEDHPFWQAEEEVFPYESQKMLKHPHMLITHEEGEHVLVYPAGQHCQQHGCIAEKYEKFVYSNHFGFSVSRGTDLRSGAFDNTLAASLAGEERYQMRYGVESFEVTEERVKTSYKLMPGVHVVSEVIPCGKWHVRIHHIDTEHEIDVAEGGFALEAQRSFTVVPGRSIGKYSPEDIALEEEIRAGQMLEGTDQAICRSSAKADLPWGISQVVSLTGGKGQVVDAFPNTNLFYPLTVIPMVIKRLMPGSHLMITCVMASREKTAEAEKLPRVWKDGEVWKAEA